MAVSKSKRIFYLDALRATAILSVIVVHVYAVTRVHVMAEYSLVPSMHWIFSQITGNCFRFGVDLFLMLAGALSLGRNWSIMEFLSKRVPRIVAPFVFWGFVTGIIAIIISYYFGFKFIFFFDNNSIFLFMLGVFKSTAPGFSPYWFFWMILGTYLIMPVFNKWLNNSNLDEVEYFLIFWLITSLFEFTIHIDFPIDLYYFTSPIGLVVYGYYLRYTKRKLLNNPLVALFLIMASATIMMIIIIYFSTPTKFHTLNRYSILMVFEVGGIFLFFKNFYKFNFKVNKDNILRKLTFCIAKYSYGIYLIQGLFLCVYAQIIPYYEFYSNFFEIFLLIVISSMIVMWCFEKIPYINKFIGSK